MLIFTVSELQIRKNGKNEGHLLQEKIAIVLITVR